MKFDIQATLALVKDPNGYGGQLATAVAEGMAPFRLKQVDVLYDFDIDFNRYRVHGAAVLLSGYTISYTVPVDAWDLAANPDFEMHKIAVKMQAAFRNRMDRSLAPRIHLGEN